MTRRIFVFRSVQVALDILGLSFAYWLAFALRFDWEIPSAMLGRGLLLWPYVVGIEYALLTLLGVPRFSWRYIGLREATRILGATVASTTIFAVLRLTAGAATAWIFARHAILPYGVILINLPLAFLAVSGVRVMRRITSERAEVLSRGVESTQAMPTLLIGAGQGGLMIAKELSVRPELGIRPLGFLDDDALKHGTILHGIRVLGSIKDVKRIAASYGAQQAIIAISNAPGETVREISLACAAAGLEVKIIPGLYKIVGGQLNLTRMRNVAIEDLLRREPVALDDAAIGADLRDRVVLVTGAGGSIGSELCRQVSGFRPKELVLLERNENALFEIHRELSTAFPNANIVPCIADIGDEVRLREVFSTRRPEVVFHAAAHKHVPMMEWNPGEAVKNNVLGTRRLADVADAFGCRAFVMISTDKAVNPTSVMGATKRAAEIYVQALASRSKTRFVTVRFGNVLGSNGSVVPIFREQIEKGGPITITHPEMRRFFMTIPEACQLVLQAGSMGQGGEIFILDMGAPVKIVDLARDLIRLSGFDLDDIKIVYSGVRPGEKLFEELSIADEGASKTHHPKIFVGNSTASNYQEVSRQIAELVSDCGGSGCTPERLRQSIRYLVPEYGGQPSPSKPEPSPEESAAPALQWREA
jgi:FlaA1/EpsC-like NDP-sugar epimerase